MSGDKRALLKQKLESGQLKLQPLTFPQRELWENSPVPVEDAANHICCIIEVRGNLTPEDGAGAFQMVLDRQEALRVSFLPGKDKPVQMIRADGVMNFHFRELTAEEGTPEGVDKMVREIASEPFDLLQGPLYRVNLLRRAPDDHVFVFTIHHAIGDGWTLGLFVQELCLAYIQRARGMKDPLPVVPQTYSAWGAVERAFWQPSELQPRIAFWKSHLAGYRRLWSALEGPVTASGSHVRLVSHFPAELAKASRELARRSSATLFSTLLVAFQVAFARWAKTDDVLVGTPVANRTKQVTKETMGYYAGIVPIRGPVNVEKTFSASLREMHQKTADCFANAIPFAELAQALGDAGAPGHNPIFEIRFALQNHPIPDVALPGLSAKLRMRSTGTARYHLACEVTEEGEQLEVVWLFRPQLFQQAEVENLGRLFESVLATACRTPEARVAALTESSS
ncbi:condensation domain-containing protein [Chthoniobacter flavus]|nr:condensation domain-containing protein [Chthoniobacter flavus]TCO94737.1 condensation domain-containing protein [Chthoniobacter flavus]